MRIDECFDPYASVVVLDLYNMCQEHSAILLGEKVDTGRVTVEFAIERVLGDGDGRIDCDGGL